MLAKCFFDIKSMKICCNKVHRPIISTRTDDFWFSDYLSFCIIIWLTLISNTFDKKVSSSSWFFFLQQLPSTFSVLSSGNSIYVCVLLNILLFFENSQKSFISFLFPINSKSTFCHLDKQKNRRKGEQKLYSKNYENYADFGEFRKRWDIFPQL